MNLKILFLFIFLISCSNPNSCGDLIYKNGVTYIGDNLYTGRCSIFYEDGTLSGIQSYTDGLDHGTWKYYYPNGVLETRGKFKLGKRVGTWKYYHSNKKIKQISFYNKLGEKDGVWKYYNEDGVLIGKIEN